MKKGINAWAKELKHNEGFARKYEGAKTVQDIINVAKTQGYDINKRDLQELDLDAVSGGALEGGGGLSASLDIATIVANATNTTLAVGAGSTASSSGSQTQTQNVDQSRGGSKSV